MAYTYPDLSHVKKILVVKLRHLGDVLLTSPVFSALKRAIPEAEITAYIYQDTFPMLDGHPAISHFLFYDQKWKSTGIGKRYFKEWQLLKKIRGANYDLVINLTEGDRGAIAAAVSKSRLRVGFDPEGGGFKGKDKIYTHLVKQCSRPRHTVEKNLDALRKMGIFPLPEERDLLLHIPYEEFHLAHQLLEKGPYILIHPVSRWGFKSPPPKKIGELIQRLHARHQKQIVLTSSSDLKEREYIDEVIREIPKISVVNLAGKTSLKQLAALIKLCHCLFCVDSVPLHMASVFKVPVVALFGPTSEIHWGPWKNSRAVVVSSNNSCRPCLMDGCGGSKMSDCLFTLPISSILQAYETVTR